jgi:hypothetical protein
MRFHFRRHLEGGTMISRLSLVVVCVALSTAPALMSQEFPRWNFNVGGGVGFPLSDTRDFSGNGANFIVGVGPNFSRYFGINGEFMWNDLPIKRSVLNQIGIPDADARQYSVTFNGILRTPGETHLGLYIIGGGGWYRRTGEATAPALVAGTVCPGFWVWWGICVNGLWPGSIALASVTSDAFGGNIGGGVTYRFGQSPVKFYTEIRYHHASHKRVNTDLLPLTFGFRW